MSLLERQNDALLRIFSTPNIADRIRLGLSNYHAQQDPIKPEDIPPRVHIKKEPEEQWQATPKRKRQPPKKLANYVYQFDDIDSDEDLFGFRRPIKRKRKRSKLILAVRC